MFITILSSNAKLSADASFSRAESIISTADTDNGVVIGAAVAVGCGTAVAEGAGDGAGVAVAVAVGTGVLVGATGVAVGSGSPPHATPNAINNTTDNATILTFNHHTPELEFLRS
jgi:hypothetical protein